MTDDATSEMVYWSDVRGDDGFMSPIGNEPGKKKYLTFEPDGEGEMARLCGCLTLVFVHHFAQLERSPP